MIVRSIAFLFAMALSGADGFSLVSRPPVRSAPTGAPLSAPAPSASRPQVGIRTSRPWQALCMSETAFGDVSKETSQTQFSELAVETDMLLPPSRNLGERLAQQMRQMDLNELLNTSVVVLLSCAVLYKLTMIDAGITRGWSPEEIAGRLAADNWSGYLNVLRGNPIATKAATSATVYAIGDVIAQRTQGESMGSLDRPRILRSLLAGLIGHGPLSHYWYEISEDFFDNVLRLTEWWSFFPKVVIDQMFWGPCWNNCYILLLGLMKRESLELIWGDVKRLTIPLVISGLKLWPLAHCVTYGLIPVENRLLWVDMVEIVWVTILATQAAGGGGTEAETVVEKELEPTAATVEIR